MLFVIKPGEDTRPIAYQTYKDFAKKYKIRLTKDKKKKLKFTNPFETKN